MYREYVLASSIAGTFLVKSGASMSSGIEEFKSPLPWHLHPDEVVAVRPSLLELEVNHSAVN
jgi:hypothetical protein